MIKIYVSPSCISSKKVIQFFNKNNIPFEKINIIQTPPTKEEIKVLLQLAPNGITDIISTRAKFIKTHVVNIENLKLSDLYTLIKTTPTILKRPIILEENRNRLQIGYHEDEIELFLRTNADNEFKDQCKIF